MTGASPGSSGHKAVHHPEHDTLRAQTNAHTLTEAGTFRDTNSPQVHLWDVGGNPKTHRKPTKTWENWPTPHRE